MNTETPVLFSCEEDTLVGILHGSADVAKVGVVIVVAGGPQYRVGAHRQFVMLARKLARRGIAVMRFDHRGTGDSTGKIRGFTDMNADINSAINTLCKYIPTIEHVILWGECESATSSAFYSYTDARVKGIFMVNPWIRTEEGRAKTYLKHYYWNRLFEKTFWLKIINGQFSVFKSIGSYFHLLKTAGFKEDNKSKHDQSIMSSPLPERLAQSCENFQGKILVLTSGKDLIAEEYKDYVKHSSIWVNMNRSGKVVSHDIADADHTFSRQEWRKELFNLTEDWIVCNYMSLSQNFDQPKRISGDNSG